MSEEPGTYTTGRAIAEAQVKDARRVILYRPHINEVVRHVAATLLLQQIYFRWIRNGSKPFYKFRAPCGHDRYRLGDSWEEELSLGSSAFVTARKKIATKITKGVSKTAVLAGEGLKSLVIYWTDSNRMTWYQINAPLYHKLIEDVYACPEPEAESLGNGRSSDYIGNGRTDDPLSSEMNTEMIPEAAEPDVGTSGGDEPAPIISFQDWANKIEQSSNRAATVVGMACALIPTYHPPPGDRNVYGRAGGAAKACKGWKLLAGEVWDLSKRPTIDDPFDYITKVAQAKQARTHSGPRYGSYETKPSAPALDVSQVAVVVPLLEGDA